MIKLSDTFVLTTGSYYQSFEEIIDKILETYYPDIHETVDVAFVGAFIRPNEEDSFICGEMLDLMAQLVAEGCTLAEVVEIAPKFFNDERPREAIETDLISYVEKWINRRFIRKGRNNKPKMRYGQLQAMLKFADKKRGDTYRGAI